jgi:multiple sugar transport system substrate-binding protein
MTLRGMTWDHPRAYRPLEAYDATAAGPRVTWERQSLADFEARPIRDLARDHDLLVVDHPGLGAALAGGSLLAVEDLVDADLVATWRHAAVGPTWDSYTVDGRQWALPIDAATQVSLRSDDLPEAPTSWREVGVLAARVPTALCLDGPHAFLSLLGMAVGEAETLLDVHAATAALELQQDLWRLVDREVSLGDPITVHAAVADRVVDYCPLAYGYASYARPASGLRPVRWSDAPTFAGTRPATVLGGTGLAVSAVSGADLDEVRAFLVGFLDPAVQTGLVPEHAGQPAARAAWDDPRLDATWGRYYTSTRASLEAAYVRPRCDGWIGLQEHASTLVREAITTGGPTRPAVDEINRRYAALVDVPRPTKVGSR